MEKGDSHSRVKSVEKNKQRDNGKNRTIRWGITIGFITFLLSLFFSFVSNTAVNSLAVKLIRNSSRVANFCADVIGDICGVLSGAVGAIIALKIAESYGVGEVAQYLISALVAALTVGGKAVTKDIAKKHSTKILSIVSKLISFKK